MSVEEFKRREGYRAFLGPLAEGEWTDEQCAEAVEAFEAIDEAHPEAPDFDNEDERTQMFSGAVMLLDEDATLREMANEWRVARQVERDTKARLVGALIAAATTREFPLVPGSTLTTARTYGLAQETDLPPEFVRKVLNR